MTDALAAVVVDEIVVDRGQSILPEHIDQAKAVIIERQDTHLDSLGRVRWAASRWPIRSTARSSSENWPPPRARCFVEARSRNTSLDRNLAARNGIVRNASHLSPRSYRSVDSDSTSTVRVHRGGFF